MIREIFRLNRHKLLKPVELVVVLRKSVADFSFDEVSAELLALLGRMGLIKRQPRKEQRK